ncbi:unnamed protein product [Closterium sp. Naga37s-1]|nr:unnamed protein product [Closterium sp. Naga37s-1]
MAVAGVQHEFLSSPAGNAAHSYQLLDSQSPEVGTSERRQHPSVSSSGGGRAASTTGAGSDGAESIAEWKRRSAEAGAHFFPLQRAEDAPSSLRDELRRRILASRGVGGGLRGKGEAGKASETTWFPLPMKEYDSTLVSTANGTMGNTMVNYSTFAGGNDKIRLPYACASVVHVYPYYVNLKLGSQKQEFSMALNLFLPHTFVPCNCLQCGSMRKGVRGVPPSPHSSRAGECGARMRTTYSKPFSTLSSSTLEYISCADQRCQKGVESGYYGCNTEGLANYLNLTGVLPGDDALCVYDANAGNYDYYEAGWEAVENGTGSYLESVGHVVQDTVYLTAPDGTEVNRSIILGCGVNQMGHWGMQGWQYGSWSAGGVLGLGWNSPFLYQLTSAETPVSFAVCLEEPTPTNKTGWDGKVPLQTGSSHLVIGAFGLTKGAANYTYM